MWPERFAFMGKATWEEWFQRHHYTYNYLVKENFQALLKLVHYYSFTWTYINATRYVTYFYNQIYISSYQKDHYIFNHPWTFYSAQLFYINQVRQLNVKGHSRWKWNLAKLPKVFYCRTFYIFTWGKSPWKLPLSMRVNIYGYNVYFR